MVHLRHLLIASLLGLASLFSQTAAAADKLTQAIWRGDIGTSLKLVQARIESNPGDFEAHRIYIDLLSGIGYAGTAVNTYQAKAHANPESADAWALLGRAAPTAPASIGAYNKALELNPKHAAALSGKAEVLRATDSTVSAIELYMSALEVDTTRAESWTGLAQAWMSRGGMDTAITVANKGMGGAVKLAGGTGDKQSGGAVTLLSGIGTRTSSECSQAARDTQGGGEIGSVRPLCHSHSLSLSQSFSLTLIQSLIQSLLTC